MYPGSRGLWAYVLGAAALFCFAVIASLYGPNVLAAAVYVAPVAVCTARRQLRRALVLAGCAAAAGGVTLGPEVALQYGVAAALGLPIGIGVARQWSYGRIVSVVVALAALVVAANILFQWEQWIEASARMIDLAAVRFENAGEQAAEKEPVWDTALLETLKKQWPAIGLGAQFAFILIGVCLAVSLTAGWLRARFRVKGPRGTFRDMRPPEWLVWLAILAAAGCFWDHRWPVWTVRVVSWNAAIGLAAVYWLNGLSIAAYAVVNLQVHLVVGITVLVMMMYLGLSTPVLCLVGLFDTWADFRRRVDALAASRSGQRGPDDGNPDT